MQFFMNEEGFYTNSKYGVLNVSKSSEAGYRPYELLLSSITGCSGMALHHVLTKMRLPFNDIHASIDAKRDADRANRVEKIHLHFTIFGENLPHNKVKRALELARKNCGMIQSVQGSIHISESFEIKDK